MRGTKDIRWGTPRHIKAQKSREGLRYVSHQKAKVCKILKGPHVFNVREEPYPWLVQWRCVCGKKGVYEFTDE